MLENKNEINNNNNSSSSSSLSSTLSPSSSVSSSSSNFGFTSLNLVGALSGVKNIMNGLQQSNSPNNHNNNNNNNNNTSQNKELSLQSQKHLKSLSNILDKLNIQTPDSNLGLILAVSNSTLSPFTNSDLEFSWIRIEKSKQGQQNEQDDLIPIYTCGVSPNNAWYPPSADDIGNIIRMRCTDIHNYGLCREFDSEIIQPDKGLVQKVEDAIHNDRLTAKIILSHVPDALIEDEFSVALPEFEIAGSIEIGSKGILICEKGIEFGGLRFYPSPSLQVYCCQPCSFILRVPLNKKSQTIITWVGQDEGSLHSILKPYLENVTTTPKLSNQPEPYLELLFSCRDRMIRDSLVLSIRYLSAFIPTLPTSTLSNDQISEYYLKQRLNALPWNNNNNSYNNNNNNNHNNNHNNNNLETNKIISNDSNIEDSQSLRLILQQTREKLENEKMRNSEIESILLQNELKIKENVETIEHNSLSFTDMSTLSDLTPDRKSSNKKYSQSIVAMTIRQREESAHSNYSISETTVDHDSFELENQPFIGDSDIVGNMAEEIDRLKEKCDELNEFLSQTQHQNKILQIKLKKYQLTKNDPISSSSSSDIDIDYETDELINNRQRALSTSDDDNNTNHNHNIIFNHNEIDINNISHSQLTEEIQSKFNEVEKLFQLYLKQNNNLHVNVNVNVNGNNVEDNDNDTEIEIDDETQLCESSEDYLIESESSGTDSSEDSTDHNINNGNNNNNRRHRRKYRRNNNSINNNNNNINNNNNNNNNNNTSTIILDNGNESNNKFIIHNLQEIFHDINNNFHSLTKKMNLDEKNTINNYEGLLKESKNHSQNLLNEYNKLKDDYKLLQSNYHNLEVSLKTKTQEHENRVNKLVSDYQLQIKQITTENQSQQGKNEIKYQELQSKIVTFEKNELFFQESYQQLQLNFENLSIEYKNYQQQSNEHNNQLYEQNQELTNKLKNINNENSNLLQELNQLKEFTSNSERRNYDLQQEILDISNSKQTLMKQISQSDSFKKQLNQMKLQVNTLNHELQIVNELLVTKTNEYNKLYSTTEINQQEIEYQKNMNNKLEKHLNEIKQYNETLENNIKLNESNKNSLIKENNRLRNTINELNIFKEKFEKLEPLYNTQLETIANNHSNTKEYEIKLNRLLDNKKSLTLNLISNELLNGVYERKNQKLTNELNQIGLQYEALYNQFNQLKNIINEKENKIKLLKQDLSLAKQTEPFVIKKMNFLLAKLHGEKNHFENKAKSLSKDLQKRLLDGTPLQRELGKVKMRLEELENERNAYRDAMVLVCDTYAGKNDELGGSWFLY